MTKTHRLAIGLGLVCALATAACGPRPPPPTDSGNGGTDSGDPPPGCGDGMLGGTEQCDGADLGGATCVSIGQGYTGGTLACTGVCSYDTSGCTAGGGCGNGTIDGGEECDGTNLGGMSCESFYLLSGSLGCTAGCTFDRTTCIGPDLIVYANGLNIGLNVRNNTSPDACEVALGCGGGTSGRDLMDFTLVSENIGSATLYFGNPGTTASWPAPYTGLWELNACGYRAFHDYATYWLCSGSDVAGCQNGTSAHVADGGKESFCFIENFGDAPDWTGADAACGMYDCGNMGQQPGCADDYFPGLDCQWMDVTGLAGGAYVICAHIDPENRIYELRDDNNIGCRTITLP